MSVNADPENYPKPEIVVEEDVPFSKTEGEVDADANAKIYDLTAQEQKHKHDIENYKNKVGTWLLAGCFGIVVIFAIIDACCKVESTLFSGAFEFAKTIATAVMGYLFASHIKDF